jgi:alpha-N-acetylglucosaminidase
VYALLERLIPGSSSSFDLSLYPPAPPSPPTESVDSRATPGYFTIFDLPTTQQIAVAATTASELSAGVGWYLRERCNMTIGWPRGGGSNVFFPAAWPHVGATAASPLTVRRIVPWSYFMNVCTHSYSLVWYTWSEWEGLIDWMALSGINLVLAMTGQEEMQYKVLSGFGLDDETIRKWFNGPAFLTWSRGQNEYGNNIAACTARRKGPKGRRKTCRQ